MRIDCNVKLIRLYEFFLENPKQVLSRTEIVNGVGRYFSLNKNLGTLFRLGLIEIYKTRSNAVMRYKLLR